MTDTELKSKKVQAETEVEAKEVEIETKSPEEEDCQKVKDSNETETIIINEMIVCKLATAKHSKETKNCAEESELSLVEFLEDGGLW